MLYQLVTPIGFLIVALDAIVLGLLICLLKQPRGATTKWLFIISVVLLTGPLSGIKLLFGSSGTMASSPGLISIRNPEQRMVKLYYLRNYPQGAWRVAWVEYVLFTDKECVLEMESQYGIEVAYKQAGSWHYAPVRRGGLWQAEITFPQDFSAVDTSGRIEGAVANHMLSECISWLSILLTIGSAGLVAALISRFVRTRLTTKTLTA